MLLQEIRKGTTSAVWGTGVDLETNSIKHPGKFEIIGPRTAATWFIVKDGLFRVNFQKYSPSTFQNIIGDRSPIITNIAKHLLDPVYGIWFARANLKDLKNNSDRSFSLIALDMDDRRSHAGGEMQVWTAIINIIRTYVEKVNARAIYFSGKQSENRVSLYKRLATSVDPSWTSINDEKGDPTHIHLLVMKKSVLEEIRRWIERHPGKVRSTEDEQTDNRTNSDNPIRFSADNVVW